MLKVCLSVGHNVGDTAVWNTKGIARWAAQLFEVVGLTAVPSLGLYEGMWEDSTRLEFVVSHADAMRIVERVGLLAHVLEQESILCEVGGSCEFVAGREPVSEVERELVASLATV